MLVFLAIGGTPPLFYLGFRRPGEFKLIGIYTGEGRDAFNAFAAKPVPTIDVDGLDE